MLRDLPKHREDKKILSYHFFRVQAIMAINWYSRFSSILLSILPETILCETGASISYSSYIVLSVFDFEWFFWP
jgi:hypothetical protein